MTALVTATLPELAWVVALASLPEVGPARLRALLRRGEPRDVLAQLAARAITADADLAAACGRGDPTPLLERWAVAAGAIDVEALWRCHQALGVEVVAPDDERWPPALHVDPDAPAVLFCAGDLGLLTAVPRVAVVGTRRCSRYGWDVAHELGATLAEAGVVVVSGLASGIDAAAHRGALDARSGASVAAPLAVVGTGLDVVYPRSNRNLWEEVAATGLVVSEAPLGTRPARWRFPARNRIIAALADAVVVVESAASGGALHTVDEAVLRDRPVLAVPGPITSPASAGTNRLLRESALVVCDPDDVLLAVGLPPRPGRRGSGLDDRDLDDDAAEVLDAVGHTVATLDAVAARARLPLGRVAAALTRLELAGLLEAEGGRWTRRNT